MEIGGKFFPKFAWCFIKKRLSKKACEEKKKVLGSHNFAENIMTKYEFETILLARKIPSQLSKFGANEHTPCSAARDEKSLQESAEKERSSVRIQRTLQPQGGRAWLGLRWALSTSGHTKIKQLNEPSKVSLLTRRPSLSSFQLTI